MEGAGYALLRMRLAWIQDPAPSKIILSNPLPSSDWFSKTMPILTIFTNIEKSSIPKDFVEETAKSVAQAAGKTKEVSPEKCQRVQIMY